ncbi:hypothetical protein [Methylobacterium sp. A54F]
MRGAFQPVPPETVAAVAALMRDTSRSVRAIARTTGVSRSVISSWNRTHRWRLRKGSVEGELTARRRAALARLYRNPSVDPGDLAEVLGPTRAAGRALMVRSLSDARGRAARRAPCPPEIDAAGLRRSLRRLVAEQIAQFDAALGDARLAEAPPGLDTARALRDLGGLKRLLDDLTMDAGGADAGGDAREPDAREPDAREPRANPADLPALRAAIADRYAAFAGERAPAGLPGEPAAGPRRGAGD